VTTPNSYDLTIDKILKTLAMTESDCKRLELPYIRPWDNFKSNIDMLLIALKYTPHRTQEALKAIDKLSHRIYNGDFHEKYVSHDEIREFLLNKTERFVQILPAGQEGSDLMQRIVTLLTMTSDSSDHAQYNGWGTQIVIRVLNGRQ